MNAFHQAELSPSPVNFVELDMMIDDVNSRCRSTVMTVLYKELSCPTCGRMALHEKKRLGLSLALLLTLLTGGFFLPVWLIFEIRFAFSSFRCQHCGTTNRVTNGVHHPSESVSGGV